MNTDIPPLQELHHLAERVIEGQITPEQSARLEHLVLTFPEARRFYADYLSLHASLQWSAAPLRVPAEPVPPQPTTSRQPGRFTRWSMALAVMAASVGLMVWLASNRQPRSVAELTDAKACKWNAGTLPTEVGAKLPPGRLRLAEGLARVVFTSGAELTLEGPADLELVSSMKCILHNGQLAANVPPRAKGFIVETPTSILTDLGTEFGVTVSGGKTADVQVFNGQVDVLHRSTGKSQTMNTGSGRRFTPTDIRAFNPNADPREDGGTPTPRAREGTEVLHISTALGRGRDAFVMPIEIPPNRRSDTLLLVKNTIVRMSDWNRKAYMALDLSPLEGQRILDAEFSLTFAPTGMGFASQVPDATFVLYGLTDETRDDWDERTIRWQNAPANRPGGTALEPDKVVRLGSFLVTQGEQTGTRRIDGKALLEFLQGDTNKLVTFILVRETQGTGTADLVHGFASKRHPNLSPPTLRLTVAKPR